MSQTQSCYVCGATGLLVEGRIFIAKDTGGPVLIGECPRCRRFICSQHGEKLDLSGQKKKKSFFGLGSRREPESFTVCCPFDPGIALGDPD
jgi:hypothetical protein